jgi:hypothetical protein
VSGSPAASSTSCRSPTRRSNSPPPGTRGSAGRPIAPFILHPLEVAQLLRGRGFRDDVIAAAVLHDVVEDAGIDPAELRKRFGPGVARLVGAVTEPEAEGPYRERKARLRTAVAGAGVDALMIYAADKVAKTRELRITIARAPCAEPDQERLELYWASLDLLGARLPDHPLVQQLRIRARDPQAVATAARAPLTTAGSPARACAGAGHERRDGGASAQGSGPG